MSTEEQLLPNYARLNVALRSIGYSFEAAVADVIDNSVDAEATRVHVRILRRRNGLLDLAISDDGIGMSGSTLREAMRFGADVTQELNRLGKFGLGMKLASLSQAKGFTVLSRHNGETSARAWMETGVASGFMSTVHDGDEATALLGKYENGRTLAASGTWVVWSELYRVGHDNGKPDEHAQRLMKRLESHLSLAFHRFLSGRARRVSISLDIITEGIAMQGLPIMLDALDPFAYPTSGHAAFPATMASAALGQDAIRMTCHVWPPNSSLPAYRLPGGANSRQGFYFYRNDRLIQAGGWNGIREAEPHLALARVEIEVAPKIDLAISLDVKKVDVQLPRELTVAIETATTSAGITFKKYLSLADSAYRKRQPTDAELPLIPSVGLPAPLTKFLHEELRIKATTKHHDLQFKWTDLSPNQFFEIDRAEGYLFLNKAYRRTMLHGLSGSAADLPVLKCLLFLLLEDALGSERIGPRLREKIDRVNRILVEAVQYERVPT